MTASADTDTAFTRAEADRLFRAIRFSLFAITLGLSYLSIRASMAIPQFRAVFTDLMEGQALPWLTTFVFRAEYVFLAVSWLLPLAALWAVFTPVKARSFYVIGAIALAAICQSTVICTALSAPLVSMVDQLGDASSKTAGQR
jgi:hypothetical protein